MKESVMFRSQNQSPKRSRARSQDHDRDRERNPEQSPDLNPDQDLNLGPEGRVGVDPNLGQWDREANQIAVGPKV